MRQLGRALQRAVDEQRPQDRRSPTSLLAQLFLLGRQHVRPSRRGSGASYTSVTEVRPADRRATGDRRPPVPRACHPERVRFHVSECVDRHSQLCEVLRAMRTRRQMLFQAFGIAGVELPVEVVAHRARRPAGRRAIDGDRTSAASRPRHLVVEQVPKSGATTMQQHALIAVAETQEADTSTAGRPSTSRRTTTCRCPSGSCGSRSCTAPQGRPRPSDRRPLRPRLRRHGPRTAGVETFLHGVVGVAGALALGTGVRARFNRMWNSQVLNDDRPSKRSTPCTTASQVSCVTSCATALRPTVDSARRRAATGSGGRVRRRHPRHRLATGRPAPRPRPLSSTLGRGRQPSLDQSCPSPTCYAADSASPPQIPLKQIQICICLVGFGGSTRPPWPSRCCRRWRR